jgi:HSP20 family protein
MRFDPFRELDRVAQVVTNRVQTMPLDAYRDGDRFFVLIDIPGVDPQSIDLTVERNVLTVRAERHWEPAEGQEVLVQERPQGAFHRQLFLGDGLDTERIEAAYQHGVLTLTVPVADQAKPHRVEITGGEGALSAITGQASARADSVSEGSPVGAAAGSGGPA